MRIELSGEALDAWALLAEHQAGLDAGAYGANAVFIGSMRDFNQGDGVSEMRLEHYPGMTENFLARIAAEAAEKWQVLDMLVVHRYGPVRPGDPIVVIGVWSAHRAQAFDACRYLIEELKARAPFWKKERTRAGERWVGGAA